MTRRARSPRDRGSLPMALLIAMVGIGLVALMVPLAVTQITSTTFTATRGQALHNAQSGLEMALGQIRAAGTAGAGDRAKLPCGPLSGTLGDGDGTFAVTIAYFYADDPSAHDDAWRKDHVMLCVNGAGPYDTASGSGTPSYALLTATGTSKSEARDRVLQATYVVKTTNRNIAGGAMPMFPVTGATTHYCMDAGTPLKAGNKVGLQPCPAANARIPNQQKWAYTTDLTLVLTTTVGDLTLNGDGTGLCLDTDGSSHAVGTGLVVKACAVVKSGTNKGRAVWNQVWSFNGSGHFAGSKSDYSDLDGYCLYASGQPAVQLTLKNNCGDSTIDPQGAWNPMPSVGAGQAGATNSQLVNFAQFGRCLDVTNQSADSGSGGSFLILYPCKQNPNVSLLDWNQKWQPVQIGTSTKVQWRTVKGSTNYCLTSPRAADQYVFVKTCASSGADLAAQTWTRTSDSDSDGNQFPYAQKYRVEDADGLCMAPGLDEYNGNAKVIVTACGAGAEQKWNADPNIAASSVIRLRETTGN